MRLRHGDGALKTEWDGKMSAHHEETVLSVHHWTDRLFSFTTTRHESFRFENGQFTMIGLETDGKPLMRAYSMVSPNYEETLEFLSIKVPDGPLTSRLQHIKEGDRILVSKKPVGTLIVDNLKPGRNLYLLATGTGLAPFMSIIRDPLCYERFEKVILVHGVRQIAELAYGERIQDRLPNDEFIGDMIAEQLVYYPTVTREPFTHQGRLTDLMTSGKLFEDVGVPRIDPAHDRAMMCGSPQMLADTSAILESFGLSEGSSGEPGEYAIEKAFVER